MFLPGERSITDPLLPYCPAIYALVPVEVWPELERAECLARGAALKWASGVFCRPEQLEKLGQYKKRESQRTASIHSRLKSVVQSYLEGVDWGLGQLREARAELREVSHDLHKANLESRKNSEEVTTLETLREISVTHCQLLAAVSNLPRLYRVRSMVLETERLVESRRLLEAHARLMELERWQDEVLLQLQGAKGSSGTGLTSEDEELVQNYFSGVGRLVDALAKELWAVVMEEAVSARFRSVSYLHTRGPGLASHLSALQHCIMGDLSTVRHFLEQCVPSHYRLTRAYLRFCHQFLQNHLGLKSVSEWMQKALEVELTDWQRDQEPDIDHEGCYHTSLPTIIAQEHRRDSTINKFYLHYLLACINNCIILKTSTESLQQQLCSFPSNRYSRISLGPLAGLDRAVKKACRLVMDHLLFELQPHLRELLSRTWLDQGEVTPNMCGVLERHCELYNRVRQPCCQRLKEECQWLTVVEYVRTLMQKRVVCRNNDERNQLAQRMTQDAQQLRDHLQSMEIDGTIGEVNPTALIIALADIINFKDPNMLILEISGLLSKYPDISEEHVSVLLDVRGDVPKDVRKSVLEFLEQNAPPLPQGYRPIFTEILVPSSSIQFCLPTAKCT
ncbi:Exocyst complex component 3-like protein [Labeo rohita]|uniref:Exocyst complex component 3-like protein n=1 Tax=Labeo rohita TaxID=84645 RepID=A0ABQ8LCJ6_LABRO|nr:Exocyst complex component 3-like protein [Labeo rohita]